MIKKLMCGLAFMGCALSSQAAVQGFDWSYSGFQPRWSSEMNPGGELGSFDPSIRFSGRFYAEDLDQNGSFSLAEVTSFSIDSQSFMGCTGNQRCELSKFAYTPGSALSFSASDFYEYGEYGSGWERNWRSFVTGDRFFSVRESDWAVPSSTAYNFTAETKFAISAVSAVPEPQTWLMLGAGMMLLGAAKRRRSRKA